MNKNKRSIKEDQMIFAAEKVFSEVGFRNAKMEDIAEAANITKVTLYTYFQSKENMYLAVTYRAIQKVNDLYYQTMDKFKNEPGIKSVVAILETFMTFCENNFLYSETLLEYFALMRSSSENDRKLTAATKESIYFMKLQDIQNLPFKLTVQEIQRGQKDGSISPDIDPMFHTLQGWMMVVGYVKLLAASGSGTHFFNVNLKNLKQLNLNLTRTILSNNVMQEHLDLI